MVVALVASRLAEGHPVWVDPVGDGATQSTVIGCEGWVVQAPILKIIVCRVCVPYRGGGGGGGKNGAICT